MRIMLTSVGRRGYLVKFFREAMAGQGEIWGGDCSPLASALTYCDRGVLLPEVTSPEYCERLLNLCKQHDIAMLVPLIDPELEVLAARRQSFLDAGVMVVVSPPRTVDISFDKYLTFKFGRENDIPVPETVITLEDALAGLKAGSLGWPLVVKPRKGSASADITYCHNELELAAAFESCPGPMIQEFLPGDEYGYDLFCDAQFQPINVYCKRKLQMRAGETDKAVSTDDKTMLDLGLRIARSLEIFGPLDADAMMTDAGPKLLELNPRFGGGYPCSHLCGANFPAKLLAMARGEDMTPQLDAAKAGVYMFKQDEIITADRSRLDSIRPCDET